MGQNWFFEKANETGILPRLTMKKGSDKNFNICSEEEDITTYSVDIKK